MNVEFKPLQIREILRGILIFCLFLCTIPFQLSCANMEAGGEPVTVSAVASPLNQDGLQTSVRSLDEYDYPKRIGSTLYDVRSRVYRKPATREQIYYTFEKYGINGCILEINPPKDSDGGELFGKERSAPVHQVHLLENGGVYQLPRFSYLGIESEPRKLRIGLVNGSTTSGWKGRNRVAYFEVFRIWPKGSLGDYDDSVYLFRNRSDSFCSSSGAISKMAQLKWNQFVNVHKNQADVRSVNKALFLHPDEITSHSYTGAFQWHAEICDGIGDDCECNQFKNTVIGASQLLNRSSYTKIRSSKYLRGVFNSADYDVDCTVGLMGYSYGGNYNDLFSAPPYAFELGSEANRPVAIVFRVIFDDEIRTDSSDFVSILLLPRASEISKMQ